MELFSLAFVTYLCILLPVYALVGRAAPQRQWLVLLVASLAFYFLAGGWQGLIFVTMVSLVTWAFSQAFGRLDMRAAAARKTSKDRKERKAIKQAFARRKRRVFVAGLVCSLFPLLVLKYTGDILIYLHRPILRETLSQSLVLPLGISFFTFQSVGYLIDTYNGKYPPEDCFPRYLLFVSYFPQLIQGPINRYDLMASQLAQPHRLEWPRCQRALLLVLLGLVKKCVISDVLVSNVNAIVLNVGEGTNGALILWGVIMYSFQMYGDFSGGIDIVEGVSELLGIGMMQNFRQPYFSTSLADFWRRWHISLGAWMRDYVFYPLALTGPMQRFGKWGTKHLGRHLGRTLPACIANIVTFLLVGLWHGASPHYVLWGIYNGLVVALSDLLEPLSRRMREAVHMGEESRSRKVLGVIRTFLLVCVGRYFDCIPSVRAIVWAFRNTFVNFSLPALPQAIAARGLVAPQTLGYPAIALVAITIVGIVDVWEERGVDARGRVLSWRWPVRILIYLAVGVLLGISMYYTGNGGGFLYANF